MFECGWKRLLSGLLALVLVTGMLPPATVAAEETVTEPTEILETVSEDTEPQETGASGTTAPAETEPEEAASTETTEATVPETTEATVPETAEATVPETAEATLPENVQAVQALIDALPTVDTVTAEDYDAVQDAYEMPCPRKNKPWFTVRRSSRDCLIGSTARLPRRLPTAAPVGII